MISLWFQERRNQPTPASRMTTTANRRLVLDLARTVGALSRRSGLCVNTLIGRTGESLADARTGITFPAPALSAIDGFVKPILRTNRTSGPRRIRRAHSAIVTG